MLKFIYHFFIFLFCEDLSHFNTTVYIYFKYYGIWVIMPFSLVCGIDASEEPIVSIFSIKTTLPFSTK
jgi:hypothetical protein